MTSKRETFCHGLRFGKKSIFQRAFSELRWKFVLRHLSLPFYHGKCSLSWHNRKLHLHEIRTVSEETNLRISCLLLMRIISQKSRRRIFDWKPQQKKCKKLRGADQEFVSWNSSRTKIINLFAIIWIPKFYEAHISMRPCRNDANVDQPCKHTREDELTVDNWGPQWIFFFMFQLGNRQFRLKFILHQIAELFCWIYFMPGRCFCLAIQFTVYGHRRPFFRFRSLILIRQQ